MKLNEKIVLVEDIWDLIAKENDAIPIPEWQKRELDKRYKEFERGEMNTSDMESVHSQIKKSLR